MAMNYDEKRSFYRMSVDCHVEFSEEGATEKYTGEGKDLSADGVKFITEHCLTEGQKLNIVVHPVIKTVVPLNAKAEVMRVAKDEQTGLYLVGVSLIEVK